MYSHTPGILFTTRRDHADPEQARSRELHWIRDQFGACPLHKWSDDTERACHCWWRGICRVKNWRNSSHPAALQHVTSDESIWMVLTMIVMKIKIQRINLQLLLKNIHFVQKEHNGGIWEPSRIDYILKKHEALQQAVLYKIALLSRAHRSFYLPLFLQ